MNRQVQQKYKNTKIQQNHILYIEENKAPKIFMNTINQNNLQEIILKRISSNPNIRPQVFTQLQEMNKKQQEKIANQTFKLIDDENEKEQINSKQISLKMTSKIEDSFLKKMEELFQAKLNPLISKLDKVQQKITKIQQKQQNILTPASTQKIISSTQTKLSKLFEQTLKQTQQTFSLGIHYYNQNLYQRQNTYKQHYQNGIKVVLDSNQSVNKLKQQEKMINIEIFDKQLKNLQKQEIKTRNVLEKVHTQMEKIKGNIAKFKQQQKQRNEQQQIVLQITQQELQLLKYLSTNPTNLIYNQGYVNYNMNTPENYMMYNNVYENNKKKTKRWRQQKNDD